MEMILRERSCREIIYHGKTCVKDMTKKEIKRLHRELKTYRTIRISILLNGRQTTAKRIEEACQIAETGGYMRDYIQDDQGGFGDCPLIL